MGALALWLCSLPLALTAPKLPPRWHLKRAPDLAQHASSAATAAAGLLLLEGLADQGRPAKALIGDLDAQMRRCLDCADSSKRVVWDVPGGLERYCRLHQLGTRVVVRCRDGGQANARLAFRALAERLLAGQACLVTVTDAVDARSETRAAFSDPYAQTSLCAGFELIDGAPVLLLHQGDGKPIRLGWASHGNLVFTWVEKSAAEPGASPRHSSR